MTKRKVRAWLVIPYVQGVSERLQRVYKKYNINVAGRPHNTLKIFLYTPRTKKNLGKFANVYEILCKNCNKSYVGETGRAFGKRLNEHKKEAKKIAIRKYTRATRKDSLDEIHKSAISAHVAQQNHIIDWEGAKHIYCAFTEIIKINQGSSLMKWYQSVPM